jgi:hypothetical protein
MKAVLAVAGGMMGLMLLNAESPGAGSDEGVLLAKRDLVELEFETAAGVGYQAYAKTGQGDWKALGQAIVGNGEPAKLTYPDDETGVEFRVETFDLAKGLAKPTAAQLPEGIEYKLTGIYRLRGGYKACVAKVDRRHEPNRTAYFTLGEGESAGAIKVVEIHSGRGVADIEAHGVPLVLSFSGNSFSTSTAANPVENAKASVGRPTIIPGPPKGKVFMAKNDPYYKEAQKKAYTNRYSLLDKPTVRSINRHVRSQPQSIFTPRVSSRNYFPQTYLRPKVRRVPKR